VRQLITFGLIGACAFLVDASVLMLSVRFGGADLYLGRVVSFLCAATFTWWLNRTITFRGLNAGSIPAQWLRYLSVNAVGGLVNFGCYALLVANIPSMTAYPVIAVGAGSLSGLAINFILSRELVFRAQEKP
jgi:putative flippase GtrA